MLLLTNLLMVYIPTQQINNMNVVIGQIDMHRWAS